MPRTKSKNRRRKKKKKKPSSPIYDIDTTESGQSTASDKSELSANNITSNDQYSTSSDSLATRSSRKSRARRKRKSRWRRRPRIIDSDSTSSDDSIITRGSLSNQIINRRPLSVATRQATLLTRVSGHSNHSGYLINNGSNYIRRGTSNEVTIKLDELEKMIDSIRDDWTEYQSAVGPISELDDRQLLTMAYNNIDQMRTVLDARTTAGSLQNKRMMQLIQQLNNRQVKVENNNNKVIVMGAIIIFMMLAIYIIKHVPGGEMYMRALFYLTVGTAIFGGGSALIGAANERRRIAANSRRRLGPSRQQNQQSRMLTESFIDELLNQQ